MVKAKETRFWASSDELWSEVCAGHKMVRRGHAAAQQIVKELHGPYFTGGEYPEDASPENHTWSFVTTKVSEMVMNNPRWNVTTRRADLKRSGADPLRHYMNRWSADHNLARTGERLLTDMLIWFGVGKCTLEENPGMSLPADQIPDAPDTPMQPFPRRVSPGDFTIDSNAKCEEEARFKGDRYVRSRLSILSEAADDPDSGWNVEVVKNLKANDSDYANDSLSDRAMDAPHREDVALWEVWVPEAKMEDFGKDEPSEEDGGDDYNGVILTLSDHQDQAGWPRDPRPYYGPPSGPYVIFGAYYVPDEVLPVSPLFAHRVQAVALQKLAAANLRSAMDYKRFIAVDDSDPSIAEKVQFTEHDGVLVISGLEKGKFVPAEIGGLTPAMVAHQDQARQYLDRVSNMSDASRGNTQAGETATAVAVAESMSAALDDHLNKKFQRALAELGQLAAYLAWSNEDVVSTLGAEADAELLTEEDRAAALEKGRTPMVTYQGGRDLDDQGREIDRGNFPDYQFEIEPFSMERTASNLLMRRRLEAHQLLMSMLPLAAQTPYWNWKKWITGMLEQFNIPGAEELLDEQMLAQVQAVAIGAAAPPADEGPSPRMASELGSIPQQRQPGQRGSASSLPGNETGALAGAASGAV